MAQADRVINAIAAPMTGASEKPSSNPVRAAHADFIAALAALRPWPIPLFADASDLEDRADHLKEVLGTLSAYLTTILDDTAQNIPGGLDLRQIDALLSDLTSEVSGTLQRAADVLAEEVA